MKRNPKSEKVAFAPGRPSPVMAKLFARSVAQDPLLIVIEGPETRRAMLDARLAAADPISGTLRIYIYSKTRPQPLVDMFQNGVPVELWVLLAGDSTLPGLRGAAWFVGLDCTQAVGKKKLRLDLEFQFRSHPVEAHAWSATRRS